MWNELVTQDTFVLPYDVKNVAKKQADELWQKHQKDPPSVRMWILENPELVFQLCKTCPFRFQYIKPRPHPFHLGNPNYVAMWNDDKIWARGFNSIQHNIWH